MNSTQLTPQVVSVDLPTTAAIYNKYIHLHFAEDEIKPLIAIERMWEEGYYQAIAVIPQEIIREAGMGILDHGRLIMDPETAAEKIMGYAFFTGCPGGDMPLLDYLAIREEYRNQGLGSLILQKLKEAMPDAKGILIETEDIAYAKTEEEHTDRLRRNAFYTRNGVSSTGVHSMIYGARYENWQLPVAGLQTQQHCMEEIQRIYRYMIPGEFYYKKCFFTRREEL